MVENKNPQPKESEKAVIENKHLNKVVLGNLSDDQEWARLEKLRNARQETYLDINDDLNLPNPKEKKGFNRRWINEENTQKALLQDWRFVNKQDAELESDIPGSVVVKNVGLKGSGEPRYAMLMEKPTEWFEADRRKRVYNVTDEKMGKIRKSGGFPEGKESAISTSLSFQARESAKNEKADK